MNKSAIFIVIIFGFLLQFSILRAQPFEANWESLEKYQIPEWYKDAKFGIFIHWGVYSVPAFFNEWYPQQMYLKGTTSYEHHLKSFGPQSEFGYKDFIKDFKAEKFNPADWAQLFKQAGAKYVVAVAEHHDGFSMYDSKYSQWCATKMGPMRDVLAELSDAVRDEDLMFGVSSHRAEHWWYYEHGMKFDSDVRYNGFAGLYGPARPKDEPPDSIFLQDWLNRNIELVEKFKPQVFWFDWWIEQPEFEPYLKKFAAYYYNQAARWSRGVAINYKAHQGKPFPDKAAVLDLERGKLAGIRELLWQTDTAVSKTSWGYVNNHQYKKVKDIINDFIDIISKNGVLLLNIGPKPDGTIPKHEQSMLREIGRWLGANAEAVYGSRPWKIYGEGPTEVVGGRKTDKTRKSFTEKDIRFTAKGDTLYAFVLGNPQHGEITIRALGKEAGLYNHTINSIELVGKNEKCMYKQNDENLFIKIPPQSGDLARVIRIIPQQ